MRRRRRAASPASQAVFALETPIRCSRAPSSDVRELGRVVAAPAVHEVVGFVDEEERVREGRSLARARERDDGIEDVVVVADHDVRHLRELERDLEGADRLGARLLENRVGVEVTVRLEEPLEEAGRVHLRAVVLRVGAVVLVAEDDVVCAHPLLRAEPHGAEGVAVDPGDRLLVDVLLRRLRRQDVEPAARFERAAEEGEERGRGLPDAGGRLGEEVLALRGGARDGGGHLALAGAVRLVGKDERRGLGRFRLGEGALLEERVEENPSTTHKIRQRLLGLVRDLDDLRRARLDVREDQSARHLPALGHRDRVHVPAQLELEALEARRAGKAREVLGEVERLDLVHDDPPAVLVPAVEASFERHGEVVEGVRERHGLLDRVARDALEVLSKDAPVDGLPDPEALEAVTPVESDPPRGAGEEGRGREGNRLLREVDRERHARL